MTAQIYIVIANSVEIGTLAMISTTLPRDWRDAEDSTSGVALAKPRCVATKVWQGGNEREVDGVTTGKVVLNVGVEFRKADRDQWIPLWEKIRK